MVAAAGAAAAAAEEEVHRTREAAELPTAAAEEAWWRLAPSATVSRDQKARDWGGSREKESREPTSAGRSRPSPEEEEWRGVSCSRDRFVVSAAVVVVAEVAAAAEWARPTASAVVAAAERARPTASAAAAAAADNPAAIPAPPS